MNKQDSTNELQRGGLTIVQDGKYVQLATVMDNGTILSEFGEQPHDIVDVEPDNLARRERRGVRRLKTRGERMAATSIALSDQQQPQFNRFWSNKALLPVAKKRSFG